MKVVEPPGGLSRLVTAAWLSALELDDCDEALTWEEAGGDSQAIVYFAFALEDALERRLPPDLFTLNMTIGSVVASLPNEAITLERNRGGKVCFVLGRYGYRGNVEEFAHAVLPDHDYTIIDVPDLDATTHRLLDVAVAGRDAAAGILGYGSGNPIILVGYSYGGSVAFEAARVLIERGATIALLAVIGATGGAERRDHGAMAVTIGQHYRRWRWKVFLLLCGLRPVRTAIFHAIRRRSVPAYFRLRQRTLDHFRDRALSAWSPPPLPSSSSTATFLALTPHHGADKMAAWHELLPDVERIDSEVKHHLILKDPIVIVAFRSLLHKTLQQLAEKGTLSPH